MFNTQGDIFSNILKTKFFIRFIHLVIHPWWRVTIERYWVLDFIQSWVNVRKVCRRQDLLLKLWSYVVQFWCQQHRLWLKVEHWCWYGTVVTWEDAPWQAIDFHVVFLQHSRHWRHVGMWYHWWWGRGSWGWGALCEGQTDSSIAHKEFLISWREWTENAEDQVCNIVADFQKHVNTKPKQFCSNKIWTLAGKVWDAAHGLNASWRMLPILIHSHTII